jgi:hypothetical protein
MFSRVVYLNASDISCRENEKLRLSPHVIPDKPTGPAFGRPDDRLRAIRDP